MTLPTQDTSLITTWSSIKTFIKDYGSVIASITALWIATRTYPFNQKSKIKLVQIIRETLQTQPLSSGGSQPVIYYRLGMTNGGRWRAANVEIDLESVSVEQDESFQPIPNWLPVPLLWTHLNTQTRDIMPKQTCWLDVLKQGHLNSVEILEACAAIQFPSDLFRVDKASKTRYQLLLRLYQQSGQSQDIILLWDPAKTPNLSIKDT